MVHSVTIAEHVEYVPDVPTVLKKRCFNANCAKCPWACLQVDSCGWDIDMDGILVQNYMSHAEMDWPQPANSNNVKHLLSFRTYYKQFI
jgi:hypothetical protein